VDGHTESSEHTPGQLAKAFQVTAGTMTSRLDRLERTGYLSRSMVPGNRASVPVTQVLLEYQFLRKDLGKLSV
jgi:DNA-binding MarR family transcriptional regulator